MKQFYRSMLRRISVTYALMVTFLVFAMTGVLSLMPSPSGPVTTIELLAALGFATALYVGVATWIRLVAKIDDQPK